MTEWLRLSNITINTAHILWIASPEIHGDRLVIRLVDGDEFEYTIDDEDYHAVRASMQLN